MLCAGWSLLRSALRQLGVEDERLRLEWISASEGEKVQRVCNEMAEQLRNLGPLRLALPGPRGCYQLPGHYSPRQKQRSARRRRGGEL